MEIFIAQNNEPHGPLTLAEVQAAVDAGKVKWPDLAWHQGCANWIPLSQVPGISIPQSRVPPPLPPGHTGPPPLPRNPNMPPSSQNVPGVRWLPYLGAMISCVISFLLVYLLLELVLGFAASIIMATIAIGTSIWVLSDAVSIGVKKGQIKGLANMNPGSWFLGCIFVWGITFPLYLVVRSEFKKINRS